ncbi:hypothetical protein Pint_08787 [Pistacia integerrima]|uniref:Uncharacterized protein n=1 Tax=Pistacia integerrima TaxID=434235 RepID=A0ACC0XZ83_9ROSI|nr:hypothetical protein Pint_08787 [Pistacia integerrima]
MATSGRRHNVNKYSFEEKVEKRPYTKEELNNVFWQHDKNRDCRLSRKELRGAFKELGAIFPLFRANRALRHADDNGDGYISEDEMEKLVNYADRLSYRYFPVYTEGRAESHIQ